MKSAREIQKYQWDSINLIFFNFLLRTESETKVLNLDNFKHST